MSCGVKTVRLSISKRVVAAVLLSPFLALSGQDMHNNTEKKNPVAGQKTAIDSGEQRFKSACAACHGSDAQGGRGPALAGNRDLQGMSDEQLFNIIRRGIPGGGMPPFPMPDEQTWQVAAFVRNLSSPASQAALPGNPAGGRELFFGKGGCSGCHAVRGQGGLVGPDLSDAGASLTVRELRESILQPGATIAPGFDSVVVYTRSGQRIEGVAKDNTNYSVDVMDTRGQLHLLNKADVREIEFSRTSLMPGDLRQRLGPEELNDLMSFLASQTVRSASAPQEQHPSRRVH